MKITHLRHVALVAPDRPASHAFFRDAWGLQSVDGGGDATYLRTQPAAEVRAAMAGVPDPGYERSPA
jgi:hypothetical protein